MNKFEKFNLELRIISLQDQINFYLNEGYGKQSYKVESIKNKLTKAKTIKSVIMAVKIYEHFMQTGESLDRLSKRYGISSNSVSGIITRQLILNKTLKTIL